MNEYVPIKTETLKRFADEARRLKEVEDEMTPSDMLSVFSEAIIGGVGGVYEDVNEKYY